MTTETMPAIDTLEVLTVAQVAHVLQVSETTTREIIQRGEIRAIRVGKQLRVRRRALYAYLDGLEGDE